MQLFRVPGGEFEAARKENNALVERVKVASVPLASYTCMYTTMGKKRIVH